jgi:hydroxymethylglutaryl-CoA synthase
MARRGILSYGAYLPYRRLDRTTIAAVAGKGGGKGTRTVASYDEDTTTMGVEAARLALRGRSGEAGAVSPSTLWFSTARPAYADKTNATAVHAALRLDPSVPAFDVNGSVRSAMGALRAALDSSGQALVVASDAVTGLPGSADEAAGGDGAAALVVGDVDGGVPPLAAVVGQASMTEEFLDRWRDPGDRHGQTWEERFGEGRYLDLGVRAWNAALDDAGVTADDVHAVAVTGSRGRAVSGLVKKLGLQSQVAAAPTVPSLAAGAGFLGAAQPLTGLAALLEDVGSEKLVGLISLADGCDVLLLATADVLAASCPAWPLASQLSAGGLVPYGTFLAWRDYLPVDPPRRPTPSRPSASAAGRSTAWKFGFVGSQGADGSIHLPPSPRDEQPAPMAGAVGTIATFTVDKLAYSPSPPVVFAVVDFDGGGRLPVELTDVDAAGVTIGDRVELTFRRLFTADGIHNYFWKARPVRGTRSAGPLAATSEEQG